MNMNNLMNQAKQIKKVIDQKTEEFNKKEFITNFQGIKIVFTGNKKVVSIEIENDVLSNKEMVEDLLPLAFNEALSKIDKEYKAFMGPLSQAPTGLF